MAIRAATLAQARAEMLVKDSDVSGDPFVKQGLYDMTARLEMITEKEYAPRKITHYLDAMGYHIDDLRDEIHLDWPLLEVITLKDGTGATLTAYDRGTQTGNYLLLGDDTPYWAIARINGGWTSYSGTWRKAIELTGFFGYRTRYTDEAWIASSDTVQNNPLSNSATSITVVDADGADGRGLTPRFSAGNLLKIESEFVEVVDTNITSNTLTVRRGVQGTMAASHVQNTPISVFVPEPPITRAIQRWCGFIYSRRGKFDQVAIDAIAAVKYPEDLPGEVQGIVSAYLPSGWTGV